MKIFFNTFYMVEAQSIMQQALEDYALYFVAEQRIKDKNCKTYTRDEN